MVAAKHAYRGTLKALQDLGLQRDGLIETVDDVAMRLKGNHSSLPEHSLLPNTGVIFSVNPQKIKNWDLHDRPENELGDIEALAEDMSKNGQAQPCIVRRCLNSEDFEYELIVGERRWRAAKLRNLMLKIVIEEIDDQQAAIYQIAENNNRKDLSDYAKGMNYYNLIESGIITQKDLEKALSKNKVEVSRLLSFGKIPKEIWNAIGDTAKISSRTASEIRAIIKKSDLHFSAIIQLAPRLKTGKLGANTLSNEVERIVQGEFSHSGGITEIRTMSGRHIFSWRKDNNDNFSISFPKDIREQLDREALKTVMKNEIERQLLKIDSELEVV